MENYKILIVDDDIDVINVLETILVHEGYQVMTASDKTEGMEKALEFHPDLAILDVMMTTQYEGFEMAKAIKEGRSLGNIPVIMLTSIEVMPTTNPELQKMAIEYRKDPSIKELDVLLLKDILSGTAGIDYKSESGKSVWLTIDGFIPKPVDSNKILPEVKKHLCKYYETTEKV